MKIAVIEIGSNGVRYELVQSTAKVVESLDVRTLRDDLLSLLLKFPGRPDIAMEKTVGLVRTYQDLARSARADKIVCFGTEVCRRIAQLDEDFWRRYGIDVQVLSTFEEARLAFVSAESSIASFIKGNNRVVIDVGNGSTDIFVANSDGSTDFLSIDVGAAMLAKAFKESNGSIAGELVKLKDLFSARAARPLDFRSHQVVIMGGLITKIAWILFRRNPEHRYRSDQLNGFNSSIPDLGKVTEAFFKVVRSGGMEGAKQFIDPYEAESWKLFQVLAGCKYFGELASRLNFSEYTVCSSSVRHGVIAEAAVR